MTKIILVAILIFSMVIPFGGYLLSQKKKRSFKAALGVNILLFFGTLVTADLLLFSGHIYGAQESAAATDGWRYMAAALSTGLSCIMGKALIFVALAESIALYGLLISFSILG